MKFNYETVTEVIEIEVSDEWGNILIDMDRQERNNNQTENRRHTLLSALEHEGEIFACEDKSISRLFAEETEEEKLAKAILFLNPKQQELIRAICFDGMSVNEYAASDGVDHSAISHRLKTIKNKLKKVL